MAPTSRPVATNMSKSAGTPGCCLPVPGWLPICLERRSHLWHRRLFRWRPICRVRRDRGHDLRILRRRPVRLVWRVRLRHRHLFRRRRTSCRRCRLVHLCRQRRCRNVFGYSYFDKVARWATIRLMRRLCLWHQYWLEPVRLRGRSDGVRLGFDGEATSMSPAFADYTYLSAGGGQISIAAAPAGHLHQSGSFQYVASGGTADYAALYSLASYRTSSAADSAYGTDVYAGAVQYIYLGGVGVGHLHRQWRRRIRLW